MKARLSLIEAINDPNLFASHFRGSSWRPWKIVLKAALGHALTPKELTFFKSIAGGRKPPKRRVRELWCIVGRRGGKDSVASLIVAHAAALFDEKGKLRPGERPACLCLASDREQAQIVKGYTRAYFEESALLAPMVASETRQGFALTNGVDVIIATNSFRAVRGRTILAAVLDECAFYRSEDSATPDIETYRAIMPGMTTIPDAILIAISSPYRRSGLLYEKYRDYFGKNSDNILVIQASSETMNPTIDKTMVAARYEEDPFAAAAEYGGQFRNDIDSFVSRDLIESCVENGVSVRPYRPGLQYFGFCDTATGTGQDSFVLAVAHRDGERAVLDLLHEIPPRFNWQNAVAEVCALLREYHISTVEGDKFAAGITVDDFLKPHGITYRYTKFVRSEIYLECLPLLTSGRACLLDNKRLVAQLSQLERKTASSGKDSIDHPKNSHDDVANAACGALVLAKAKASFNISNEMLRRAGAAPYRSAAAFFTQTDEQRAMREKSEQWWRAQRAGPQPEPIPHGSGHSPEAAWGPDGQPHSVSYSDLFDTHLKGKRRQ